ncbi:hypothetical protein SDC9_160529 [bioreactor metagenome]|uniref:Uncharacterized protein n=1 Tax=bioreactor metagenome TaxID=1076179 RepID=A0A645FIN2_9ZZZZ
MHSVQDDGKLHKAARYRGNGRALHTHAREAQMAVNQNIVADEVDQNSRDAGLHWQNSLPRFPQRA